MTICQLHNHGINIFHIFASSFEEKEQRVSDHFTTLGNRMTLHARETGCRFESKRSAPLLFKKNSQSNAVLFVQ